MSMLGRHALGRAAAVSSMREETVQSLDSISWFGGCGAVAKVASVLREEICKCQDHVGFLLWFLLQTNKKENWDPVGISYSHSREDDLESWFSSVQSLSCVLLFVTPWTAARQASLSITNSQSPPNPTSIESVMPSNHLILCCPLLFLLSVFPSIRVFSNELDFCVRWPKYWSFSFNINPSKEHPGLISFRMDWLDLHAVLEFWQRVY